jgi:hypothetical protein
MRFLLSFFIAFSLTAFSQSRVTVMTGTNGAGVWPTNFFTANSNAINAIVTGGGGGGGSGTVTSVNVASPDLTVSGGPVTSSGTITIYGTNKQPASANLTNWSGTPTNAWTTKGEFNSYTNGADLHFQTGSANLTNWSGVATNLFATLGQLNLKLDSSANILEWAGTTTNLWATLGQLNLKQTASGNLDSWSGTATNLWATIGQLNTYTNTAESRFQPATANGTNWAGTATNAIPRALTNAGNSSASLINDSNAPTFKLKSLSASGASITDQGTNILLTVTAGGSGTVTSVAASSSTLTIGGSPITSSGTLTIETPWNTNVFTDTNLFRTTTNILTDTNTFRLYTNFANTRYFGNDGLGTAVAAMFRATNAGGYWDVSSQDSGNGPNYQIYNPASQGGLIITTNGDLLPFYNGAKLGDPNNGDYPNRRWNGSNIMYLQPTNANLTAFGGIATNQIPRALTNAGNTSASLINDSNAPTWKLKSISASGGGLTITDQSTNLLLTVPSSPSILDTTTAYTYFSNTVSETVFYSFTIPSGSLTNGRTIRSVVNGYVTNNSGASRTFTLKVRLGGTSLAGTVIYSDVSAAIVNNAAPRAFALTTHLSDDGTGSGQCFAGELNIGTTGTPGTGQTDMSAAGSGPFNFGSRSAGGDFTGVNAGTNLLFEITISPTTATNSFGFGRHHARSILE